MAPLPSRMGGGAAGEADATRKGEGRPLSVRAGEAWGTAGVRLGGWAQVGQVGRQSTGWWSRWHHSCR